MLRQESDASNTAELDTTSADPRIISKISLALGKVLIEMQLDERADTGDHRIKQLERKLTDLVKNINPNLATPILQKLAKHFTFIRAAFEYDSILNHYLFTATIPTPISEHQNFKRGDVKEAIKALEYCTTSTQTAWTESDYFVNRLIAPIIFYNIFHSPSAKALDFYISHFDKDMMEDAKEFITQNVYSIYKGRTRISADLICTRFAEDKAFISGLLPPVNKDPYFAYTVFTGDNVENMKTCWNAATPEQQKALLNVASNRHGDIFPPALVAAYQNKNEEIMEWLWSLAGSVEEKKQMLRNVIQNSRNNPVLVFFAGMDSQDNKYYKTAIKLAIKDEQHFVELVEDNNCQLLKIAAQGGNIKLINKYLDQRRSPLAQDVYDKVSHSLDIHDTESGLTLSKLHKLNPSGAMNVISHLFNFSK